jgi:hypothetical protein
MAAIKHLDAVSSSEFDIYPDFFRSRVAAKHATASAVIEKVPGSGTTLGAKLKEEVCESGGTSIACQLNVPAGRQ